MATSTFGKQFTVIPEKADDFVNEMTRPVTPTLEKDFRSEFVNLVQEKELKAYLQKALSR